MRYRPAITNLPLLHQGKTRDTFEAVWSKGKEGQRQPRLIVATDRLSTHNIVHESTIPKKGEVLTALTVFWFRYLGGLGVRHHLLACGTEIYDYVPALRNLYPDIHLRSIVVETLDMRPIEFIFRAYLCGSLWDKFYSKGIENPYGISIPKELSLMTKFDTVFGSRPVFTPTDKSEDDDPVSAQLVRVGYPLETALSEFVFAKGREYLQRVGIAGIDSKFELGIDENGNAVLGDEVWTLDSSRMARASDTHLGVEPPWLDKQLARDEAVRQWGGGSKSPLTFSDETITNLSEIYVRTFEMIVQMSLEGFQRTELG